jgi:DNA-binding transcriptional MerR regulator
LPKAVEAFRNIGEVSIYLGVKKHVLRFWEVKFPQLKPMKRGGGRRLYRPGDVELLRGIRDLLQTAGYTIKGVQKIIREHGIDHVKAVAGHAATAQVRLPCLQGEGAQMAVAPRPSGLSDAHMKALRAIANELTACQVLLGQPRLSKSGPERLKRMSPRS